MTVESQAIAPGIYYGMPAADYHAAPGLSQSGMKDLDVSPLRYWYLHVNPNRPVREETKFMAFGTALHALTLEPERFASDFACELDTSSIDGLLDTMADLRAFMVDKGLKPKGTTKAELVAQVYAVDPSVPILSMMQEEHAVANEGRQILSLADWNRVQAAAGMLNAEPEWRKIIEQSKFEVSIFADDPETGVRLKCRMDAMTPTVTADIKTFSQKRGRSIDESVCDAIYYEKYYRQGYFYRWVRGLQTKQAAVPVFAFVESEQPHETRLKRLTTGNLYWQMAKAETERLVRLYAYCQNTFGTAPWRTEQDIEDLNDEDVKQFAY